MMIDGGHGTQDSGDQRILVEVATPLDVNGVSGVSRLLEEAVSQEIQQGSNVQQLQAAMRYHERIGLWTLHAIQQVHVMYGCEIHHNTDNQVHYAQTMVEEVQVCAVCLMGTPSSGEDEVIIINH